MPSMVSATVAPTRLTDPSSASESRPTESVIHQASAFSTIVARAAAMESRANLRAPVGDTSGSRGAGRERIGIELVFRQPALGGEITPRRVDHYRRAAGVDLVAGQIGKILHHRAVHESRAAGPGVGGKRVREHRHVAQL